MWSLFPGVLCGKDGEVGGWGKFGLIRAVRKPESCFLMDKTSIMTLHQKNFSLSTEMFHMGSSSIEIKEIEK